jgi:hypothetical protein
MIRKNMKERKENKNRRALPARLAKAAEPVLPACLSHVSYTDDFNTCVIDGGSASGGDYKRSEQIVL